jgi:hypothetical protein
MRQDGRGSKESSRSNILVQDYDMKEIIVLSDIPSIFNVST